MPHLELKTNLPDDAITEDFIKRCAKLLAVTTGNPEKIVGVIVSSNKRIFSAGSFDPAVWMSLSLIPPINGMSIEDKNRYCDEICSFVMKELNLPEERVELCLMMFDASNVGSKSGTVQSVWTKQASSKP
ncbi:macrophage migration inhibitory factor-like [Anneissia japonica]|uniref:macrophage migration inhibitory factor-like n=1 Tax=Anneissia japonica TaxID=1529436 RepID=UPI001425A267|nr:macrophage migration inhibitory factor-like [Anneissia japonica]